MPPTRRLPERRGWSGQTRVLCVPCLHRLLTLRPAAGSVLTVILTCEGASHDRPPRGCSRWHNQAFQPSLTGWICDLTECMVPPP